MFTFQRLTLFIINLARKTLQIEINNFTESIGCEDASKQAFSKARKKLNPIIFKLLNEKFVSDFYTDNDIETFHGYRILAVDGSKIQLPSSEEIIREYGCCASQYGEALPMAQASILFDVLNKVTIDSLITPFKTSERDLAAEHIDKVAKINKSTTLSRDEIEDLFLFDRGYPSISLLTKLSLENKAFVFRCQKSFIPQLSTMLINNHNDAILTIKVFDTSRKKRFRECIAKLFPGLSKNFELKIRIVLFTLESGDMEILVTSLLDKNKFTRETIFDLYNLRWGTEENNKYLKAVAQLENFSGKSKTSVEQDFYATVFTCNVANLLAQEALDDMQNVSNDKELKYEYVVNKNIALGILKDDLILALLSNNDLSIFCADVKQRMIRSLVPIRKNRTFPRKKSKNRTFPRKKSKSRKYSPNCRKSI